ncbi:MAG: RNA-binding protein [DPANN group archaeon]|nr:RNA-binding protein [DPANN group archaeon]
MVLKQISKRDKKSIVSDFEAMGFLGIVDVKGRLELDNDVLFVDGKPKAFLFEGKYYPTLKVVRANLDISFKTVTIDMGAIPFVTKGADIMRPGIVSVSEDVKSGDFIVIIDEKNKVPLAVGLALLDSFELMALKSGKVVRNLHFAGDLIWALG